MKEEREMFLSRRCSKLVEILRVRVPADQALTFRSQELRDIFTEAAELAKNIRLSTAVYEYRYSCKMGEALFLHEIQDFNVLDRSTAQLLRSSDMIQAGPDSRIGEKLCMIHPAFVRKGKNGGRDITLVKATILCGFDQPIHRRRTKKATSDGETAHAQHKTEMNTGSKRVEDSSKSEDSMIKRVEVYRG